MHACITDSLHFTKEENVTEITKDQNNNKDMEEVWYIMSQSITERFLHIKYYCFVLKLESHLIFKNAIFFLLTNNFKAFILLVLSHLIPGI